MSFSAWVYADTGVDRFSLSQTSHLLASFGGVVREVYATDLSALSPSQVDILAIPGGADRFYFKKLQGERNRRIIDFVERGGKYVGICAGAYYAASHIEFAVGTPLEIHASRELAFFPHCVKGPLFKEFAYNSSQGAHPALLVSPWLTQPCAIYYNGGGYFVEAEKYPGVDILARFAELPDTPPALITCKVGKGSALLSSVHFEYDPDQLHSKELSSLIPLLTAHQRGRQELLHLLRTLLLNCTINEG